MNKKTKEKKVETYEVVREKSFWEWFQVEFLILFGPISIILLLLEINFFKKTDELYNAALSFASNIIITTGCIIVLLTIIFSILFIILYITYLITVKRIVKVKK